MSVILGFVFPKVPRAGMHIRYSIFIKEFIFLVEDPMEYIILSSRFYSLKKGALPFLINKNYGSPGFPFT
jgi:hypothetical protein